MAVNDKQKRYLKGLAHKLKPVVMIGNKGLTENVVAEIDSTLNQHELIKVRVSGQEREDKAAMVADIEQQTGSELIALIGHIAVLYRVSKEAKITLPK